jgi:hypothetical protein
MAEQGIEGFIDVFCCACEFLRLFGNCMWWNLLLNRLISRFTSRFAESEQLTEIEAKSILQELRKWLRPTV